MNIKPRSARYNVNRAMRSKYLTANDTRLFFVKSFSWSDSYYLAESKKIFRYMVVFFDLKFLLFIEEIVLGEEKPVPHLKIVNDPTKSDTLLL